jgi:hypothetical protein
VQHRGGKHAREGEIAMRKLLPVVALLAAAGCHKQVVVPTVDELKADPKLLAEWQGKCNAGEYAHLPAMDKANMCFTTQAAGQSLAAAAAAKADSDFFDANTLRK